MREISEVSRDIAEARVSGQDWESVIQPLYDEQREIIKHNREKFEDDNYSVEIDCPVHITHKALLFIHGHTYAGIWECPVEDISDSCPHWDVEIEKVEDNDGRKSLIYVCSKCGVDTKGDPDADADGE